FAVVYGDSSAHTLMNGLDAKTLLGIITRDGNEKLDEKMIRPPAIKGKDGGGFDIEPVPAPPLPPPAKGAGSDSGCSSRTNNVLRARVRVTFGRTLYSYPSCSE